MRFSLRLRCSDRFECRVVVVVVLVLFGSLSVRGRCRRSLRGFSLGVFVWVVVGLDLVVFFVVVCVGVLFVLGCRRRGRRGRRLCRCRRPGRLRPVPFRLVWRSFSGGLRNVPDWPRVSWRPKSPVLIKGRRRKRGGKSRLSEILYLASPAGGSCEPCEIDVCGTSAVKLRVACLVVSVASMYLACCSCSLWSGS